MNISHAIIEKP